MIRTHKRKETKTSQWAIRCLVQQNVRAQQKPLAREEPFSQCETYCV